MCRRPFDFLKTARVNKFIDESLQSATHHVQKGRVALRIYRFGFLKPFQSELDVIDNPVSSAVAKTTLDGGRTELT